MTRNDYFEARKLRQQGMSVKQIARTVGASQSTISVWVRDITLTEQQKAALYERRYQRGNGNLGAQANRAKNLDIRRNYQEAGRVKARENRPLHLAGCMLYWAEGAKARNEVHFVNSDSEMMRLFIRFLREELDVSNDNMAIKITCHVDHPDEIRQVEQYWLDLLNLPESCLRKTQIKSKGQNTRHNTLANGVCGLRVPRTEIVQHIYGAIQEYIGADKPEWLG